MEVRGFKEMWQMLHGAIQELIETTPKAYVQDSIKMLLEAGDVVRSFNSRLSFLSLTFCGRLVALLEQEEGSSKLFMPPWSWHCMLVLNIGLSTKEAHPKMDTMSSALGSKCLRLTLAAHPGDCQAAEQAPELPSH